MANRSVTVQNALPALLVVGLGMLLIAGLSGIVLWLVTRRRAAVVTVPATELSTAAEPAEA